MFLMRHNDASEAFCRWIGCRQVSPTARRVCELLTGGVVAWDVSCCGVAWRVVVSGPVVVWLLLWWLRGPARVSLWFGADPRPLEQCSGVR